MHIQIWIQFWSAKIIVNKTILCKSTFEDKIS